MRKAIITGFRGVIVREERSTGLVPVEKIRWTIKALCKDYTILISSSSAHSKDIDNWLKENELSKYFYLIYGKEDGVKEKHFEKIMTNEEFDRVICVGNSPKDFFEIENKKNIVRIAVDAHPNGEYPEDVLVFYEPLSMSLVREFGGN